MVNRLDNIIDKGDFWVETECECYIHICEGTGDNLLPEDIDEGYIDYIYYEVYNTLQDVYDRKEYDGGMVLLKEYYVDLSIEDIVNRVADMSLLDINLK